MALVQRRPLSLKQLLMPVFLADRCLTTAQEALCDLQELQGQFEQGQAPTAM